MLFLFILFFGFINPVWSDNQSSTTTPILTNDDLPFAIQIEQDSFVLPNGIHSYAAGTYNGKYLLLAGRANGLHGFNDNPDNIPPQKQNREIFVVDPVSEQVITRSLVDPYSGLTQRQIDDLSVTSPQAYQIGETLYITGGYGVISETGEFNTKDTLTAIDIPGLMHWVENSAPTETAAQYIRQIHHPIFKITGGYMDRVGNHSTLLIFGQDFEGFYFDPNSNGIYSKQVRRFRIQDDGVNLSVKIRPTKPNYPNPNYRRRDLNVVPIVQEKHGSAILSFIAYAGVFTPSGGVWTVPVRINARGKASMPNPINTEVFMQGMNQYTCPTLGIYSPETKDMLTIFFGGISYGYFSEGAFQTDSEIPFINQITAIKFNKEEEYSQYLLPQEYPVILSTGSNPGNRLLFGAGSQFMPISSIPSYANGVIKLDELPTQQSILVGYIIGGIQSTLSNTNTSSDSAASPYIFKVFLTPR